MQAIKASLLLVAANAISLERHHHHNDHKGQYLVSLSAMGIDEKELMEGAHWRKKWPEGNTDAGHDDDLVINLRKDDIRGRNWLDKPPHIDYSYKLDSDVIDTQKHLEDIEADLQSKFSEEGY